MANLLLAYFSQAGHATKEDDREDYAEWILTTLLQTYAVFEETFSQKWHNHKTGSLYPETLLLRNDTVANEQALSRYLRDIVEDSIGFAGAKIVRRILGIAHVEDLETIQDENLRADCEKKSTSAGAYHDHRQKEFLRL